MKKKIRLLKGFTGLLGGLLLGLAGVFLVYQSRCHQLSKQPMPNYKGGFMTCGDGYYLALIMGLMSLIWIIYGVRSFSKNR